MSQQRIKAPRKPRKARQNRWFAFGTLAAYTSTIGLTHIAVAQRPTAVTKQTAPDATKTDAMLKFDIWAGSLGDVLAEYSKITGVRVAFIQDNLSGLSSDGVVGLYSTEGALRRLLEGTGLQYRFTGPSTVLLEIATSSTSVEVTATAPLASLTKYSEPIIDTPQSIAVVTQDLMKQQGATTLRDSLRNVAGISLAAGEGGAQGDNLTIRGFSARNDIFLDGMRDFGSYYRDPFVFEQVQVLEGPSSVTFGRGSTGGVVNQVTKTPSLGKSFGGTVQLGTDSTRRIVADFDHPVTALGDNTAFRLNLMAHDAQVSERDIAETRRVGVAPSLAFGLSTPTTFRIGYIGEWADDTPDYGIPWYFNEPAQVDRQNYYGFRHGNFLKTQVNIGTASAEHRFNENLRLRSQFRYAHYDRNARISEAQIPAPPVVTPDTPLDEILINRNQIAVNSTETFLQDQTDLLFSFNLGHLRNDVVTGFEATRETSTPTRYSFTGVPQTSLLDPDTTQPFAGDSSIRSSVSAKASSIGGYVLDTVHVGAHVDVMGGVRVDRFDTDYDQFLPTPLPLNHLDVMASWRGAIVYKPSSKGSIYFDGGNSFNPSAETLSLSAATTNLDPEENRTLELGTKWELGSRLSLRGSIFQTDKLNAREPDPNDSTLNVLAGKQRVRGIDVAMSTRISSRWSVQAGYAFLNAKLISSNAFPAAVGAQLANVPKNSFNVWTNYEFPWHLSVGGGGQFIDSRTASSTVPKDPTTGLVKEAPGYVVFNAMAAYPLTEHLSLQVNAYNLGNKYYYDLLHPAHIIPGPGRSLLGGMNFKF